MMTRRNSATGLGSGALPENSGQDARLEQPDWRAWMRTLGQRQRRLREFLGFSQEQLARLAGVSQGAVSRLEIARGLATPLLIVMKIHAVLARELRRHDPSLLSAELREAVALEDALVATGGALGVTDVQVADDAELEELVRLYREAPVRLRPGVVSVVRALITSEAKSS
jgi:transcriptional regulator with XRE-family HTH domain